VTFWELFIRLLPWRPWPALTALYWHLTRRRVRARNRLLAAIAPLPFAYDVWMARIERESESEAELLEAFSSWRSRPKFSVILHGSENPGARERSIESIAQQTYPDWGLIEGSNLADAISDARGDFVILLRAGDQVASTGLYRLAQAIESNPEASLFYGDQDEVDASGRRIRPWFKPEWNEELFLAQDFLSGMVAIGIDLVRQITPAATDVHALLLAATSAADGSVTHVPHIVSHAGGNAEAQTARLPALAHHLKDKGATCRPGLFGATKVEWPLPAELPLVSVIIPTKDKLELLGPCVDGVLNRTDYGPLEILILDNGSVEPATAEYLAQIAEEPRVRVIAYPAPYNFSAINNFAVREAKGSHLCLLNNDTEVISPDWLAEMMRHAVRHEVGAVGAKLLYEDGSIQHAGVAIGIGEAAGHSHRFLRKDERGYFGLAHATHFVSAVTAACLVVDKRKYLAVGGLDEENLAVAFNDVDFCLKLQAAGWRNVYTPHAVLVHHESKSRGSDLSAPHVDRFRRELKVLQDRWGTRTVRDPLHNPNLDRYSETFVLRL
jgi:O-antigen biosynthesis protein